VSKEKPFSGAETLLGAGGVPKAKLHGAGVVAAPPKLKPPDDAAGAAVLKAGADGDGAGDAVPKELPLVEGEATEVLL
jgi:hypothetical protein